MNTDSNIQTIKNVYESFARGDVEAILAVVADTVDWGTDTSSDVAPWWGVRTGREGVGAFFSDFATAMDVEEFTPLTFAATGDEVLTVVRFRTRSRKTGKTASMHLHHWFRFEGGKIAYYRGTEDTVVTAEAVTTVPT